MSSNKGLHVVVLGATVSGKTSVINALLDQTKYRSWERASDCVRREGEVGGRTIVFIDTPGWWRQYPLIDTTELVKQELVLSLSKCPSGPHAFLLVIGTDDPFPEKNRRSVEEHVGIFGENVWEHTILVFTRGASYEFDNVEQYIDSEGAPLKWLVEKCGHRCHMFDIRNGEGSVEASKLLEQIDFLAKTNSHFMIDEKAVMEVQRRRKTNQDRAQLRQQKVLVHREMLKKEVVWLLPELRILLLGWLLSGKTSASKTILGHEHDEKQSRTDQCEIRSKEIAGRKISVVDTPGWWKYLPSKCTPEQVKTELQRGLTLESKAPHAILLTVPVNEAFLKEQRKITEDNMKMFGDNIWRHTIVLFTCGDMLGDTSIEEHIESEGEPLQWLVEKCGNRYHVMSWNDKFDDVKELLQKIDEMVASNSLFRPEPEAQNQADTDEEIIEVPNEMVHFLDQKWQRMDKSVEEMIRTCLSEMGKRSMDGDLANFHDDRSKNVDCSENSVEEMSSRKVISPMKPTQPGSFIKESDIMDPLKGHKGQEQIPEKYAGGMERLRQMFEREWGRREACITGKFQRLLSNRIKTGSEADVHDLYMYINRSYRKVVWWMNHRTSGFYSDPHAEDLDTEEMDVTE